MHELRVSFCTRVTNYCLLHELHFLKCFIYSRPFFNIQSILETWSAEIFQNNSKINKVKITLARLEKHYLKVNWTRYISNISLIELFIWSLPEKYIPELRKFSHVLCIEVEQWFTCITNRLAVYLLFEFTVCTLLLSYCN